MSSRAFPATRRWTAATAARFTSSRSATRSCSGPAASCSSGTTVQFSRLAVRQSARRRGIATTLLEEADAQTRAGGARRLVLHAQTYARELYERAGYRPRGRAFVEAGIEHVAMEKTL